MLNRAALIVRPRQPFLDWAASLEVDGLVPDAAGERTVYLIPEPDDDAHAERIVRRVFAEIFERELDGWWTDESAWPTKRTFAVFKQWFSIEIHTVIEDLVDDVLHDDDFDSISDLVR